MMSVQRCRQTLLLTFHSPAIRFHNPLDSAFLLESRTRVDLSFEVRQFPLELHQDRTVGERPVLLLVDLFLQTGMLGAKAVDVLMQ